MASTNTVPYTYLIGWSSLNLWYYGVRYAIGCHPSDLWNPYTTSSKHVNATVRRYGNPDIKQIRKTFKDSLSARNWESRVLKKLKVVKDSRWLNKTDTKVFEPLYGDSNPMRNPAVAALIQGENHGNKKLENRIKISIAHKSKGENHHTKSADFRKKMSKIISELGDRHPMKQPEYNGDNHPMRRSENRIKASENNTGQNNPMFGKKHTRIYCNHCGQHISVNTYPRWHGKNCKNNFTGEVVNTDDSVYN